MLALQHLSWYARNGLCSGESTVTLPHLWQPTRRLRDHVRRDLVQQWELAPTQGEVVREHGTRLVRWLDTVRREGDGARLLFALEMCTLQVSTPCRLLWGSSREPSAITCSLCGSLSSPRHPFLCPGTTAARQVMQRRVATAACAATLPLIESGVTSTAHQQLCLQICSSHLRWFDLSCQPEPDCVSDGELPALAADIESFDRWAGLCGLLPKGLCTLLLPPPHYYFVAGNVRPVDCPACPCTSAHDPIFIS